MGNDELTVSDYIAILRRRSLSFGASVFVVLLAFIALAYILPATYHSYGTILIEQQDVPEDLVRSTVSNYANERLQIVTQRVMTVENLSEIIKRHDLYASERASGMAEADVVELFRADTSMEPLSAEVTSPSGRFTSTTTIAFTVGFRAPSADKSQIVAKELVDLYLKENSRNRTEAATETTAFLSRQAETLKAKLADQEAQLASFKAQYGDSLPEFQRLNLDRLEAAEQEIADLQQEIRAMRDSRDLLGSELAVISPFAAYESADGVITADPRRLDQLQRDYISLASKYGPSHPDLIRLRREIELLTGKNVVDDLSAIEEQLFALRQQLDSAKQVYGDGHPDVARIQQQISSLEAKRSEVLTSSTQDVMPTNPLYIQKQGQLNATRNQLASAEQRLVTLNQRRTDYERRLQVSPEVERNFVALARENEATLTQFREIQGKLQTATIAETLEVEQRGERFSLTNPPLLPADPESPNRIAVVLLGFVLALGAGIGLVVLAESLDTTVRSPKDVMRILHAEPIASISYVSGPDDIRKRRTRTALIGGAALASVAVVAVIIQAAG